jgi:hypothetical protein
MGELREKQSRKYKRHGAASFAVTNVYGSHSRRLQRCLDRDEDSGMTSRNVQTRRPTFVDGSGEVVG